MKELKPGPMAPVGYPVPRRAVLAGPVAAGVLAWASRLRGSVGLTARDGSACIVNASRLTRTFAGPPVQPRSLLVCAAAGPVNLLAHANTPAATGPASTARRGTG